MSGYGDTVFGLWQRPAFDTGAGRSPELFLFNGSLRPGDTLG
jgi:hypothetical protein